jgi:glutamine synthetase adenylyltransferase
MYPDTIRLLESVGSAGLVDHAVIDGLIDAYRDYRHIIHRRSLEGRGRILSNDQPVRTAAWVGRVWEAVMLRDAEPPRPDASV